MGFLQPWSLVLFAVASFLGFLAIGAKTSYKTEVPMMTRWIVAGICVVIVTIGVFKVLQDRNRNSFQSGTEVPSVNGR
jgi:hypothetical protein